MRALVALSLPGGPAFVDHLERAWAAGDAVAPLDPRLPAPARHRLLDALRPARLVDADGTHDLAGAVPVAEGDAVVVATSGTTGRPRGVVHTHRSLAAAAEATSAALGVDPARDGWLGCLPVAHVAGLAVVVRARWAGTPLTVLPGFDAAAVEGAARRGEATLTAVVPTVLDRFDTSAFRVVLVGGAAVPAALPPSVVATYGTTETGGGVVYDGLPLEGVEVALGPVGGVGRPGEVVVRSPTLARAVRAGPDLEAGAPVAGPGGWYATGDVGAWGPGGGLRIEGRLDDLIVTGGVNVWPAAVEAALATHPAVAEVAVVGRPDPRWGARVTAVVVPAPGAAPPTLAGLRAWAKERLPAAAAPQGLEVVAALPRTALGKVRRSALAVPGGEAPAPAT